MSDSKTAVRAVVRGRVQGVGFRDAVVRRAAKLGVLGWVRNADDGTVAVHAEGPQPEVEELVGFLEQGPPGAQVESVEVEDHSIEHNDFEGELDGGWVKIWDRGSYEQGGRVPWPEALERGHAVFALHGEKLKGGFALQRTRGGEKPQWLLIKRKDEFARPG